MIKTSIIIVGGGPAGLTAALYCGRARVPTIVLERTAPGGQILITAEIENYPGFPDGIHGWELAEALHKQAARFGAEFATYRNVESLSQKDGGWEVVTPEETYWAKAIILATGASPKKLQVPGELEYIGKGVSYCATCDGAFFREKDIAVVGGGDTAVEEGVFLTRFANKVTVIHRRDALRADKIIQERAFANDKIDFIWDSIVTSVNGSQTVESLTLQNVKSGESSDFPTAAAFILIGIEPNTSFMPPKILDSYGFIETGSDMASDLPGLFAAGDVRCNQLKQIVVATGEGAVAADSAIRYVEAD